MTVPLGASVLAPANAPAQGVHTLGAPSETFRPDPVADGILVVEETELRLAQLAGSEDAPAPDAPQDQFIRYITTERSERVATNSDPEEVRALDTAQVLLVISKVREK